MSRPISAVHFVDVRVKLVCHRFGIVHRDIASNSLCSFLEKVQKSEG